MKPLSRGKRKRARPFLTLNRNLLPIYSHLQRQHLSLCIPKTAILTNGKLNLSRPHRRRRKRPVGDQAGSGPRPPSRASQCLPQHCCVFARSISPVVGYRCLSSKFDRGGRGGVSFLVAVGGRAANLFRDNEGGQSRKLTSRASSLASGSCIQSTRQAKLRVPHPTYPTNHNHPILIPPTHKCLPPPISFFFSLFPFLFSLHIVPTVTYCRRVLVNFFHGTSSSIMCTKREKIILAPFMDAGERFRVSLSHGSYRRLLHFLPLTIVHFDLCASE